MPYGTIADALAVVPEGGTIALSRGRFDEPVVVDSSVTIWGACAAETILSAGSGGAVVEVSSGAVVLRGLLIADSERFGLQARGLGVDVEVDGVVVSRAGTVGVLARDGATLHGRSLVVSETQPSATGDFGRGIEADTGATVTIGRLIVEANHAFGAFATADGTRLEISDAVVRDTRARPSDDDVGRGLSVQRGARAVFSRVLLEGNRDVGVFATSAGTHVQLTDVVVRETQPRQSDGWRGRGVAIYEGATVELERAFLDRNTEHGVFLTNEGTRLVMRDAVIRDVRARSTDGTSGRGVEAIRGAEVQLSRVAIERCREFGVLGAFEGTHLALEDVVVRETAPGGVTGGDLGRAFSIEHGTTAEITRALFEGNHQAAVYVNSENVPADVRCDRGSLAPGVETRLVATDIVVRDTQPQVSDMRGGLGLAVKCGAAVELERALFERNGEVSVLVEEEGSTLTATDLVIRDTLEPPALSRGRAVNLQLGGSASLSRVLVERSQGLGLFVATEGTHLALTDAVVRDTGALGGDGTLGRALNVQLGATAEVSRSVFEAARDVGVYCAGAGARVDMSDTVVRTVRSQECADTTCPEMPAGIGVVSFFGGAVTMTRFLVSTADLCGLLVARDSQLDLHQGEVSGNPIGICVQIAGYDTLRLADDVLYRDNGSSFEATDYAAPQLVDPDL